MLLPTAASIKTGSQRLIRCRRLASVFLSSGYHSDGSTFGFVPKRSSSAADAYVPPKAPTESPYIHLINAYRRFGYLQADLDPLALDDVARVPELDPAVYGFKLTDKVEKEFTVEHLVGSLKTMYCGPLAAEFMHITKLEERNWFGETFAAERGNVPKRDQELRVAQLMLRSQNFDNFLAKKFPTVKRYGCEGAESMLAFFDELFNAATEEGVSDIVTCIAHRGRLNLLVELMDFPVVQMFRKMKGKLEFPESVRGAGDVLSHFTSSFDYSSDAGQVHVTMLPNPSHLEAVNPVALGKARARALTKRVGDYGNVESGAQAGDDILCLQVHGDGAFTGQGVVWESIALSQVPHFRVGGSIHLVTNNQIAFTAEGGVGRSTRHCTDIAKAFDCPVIHVNGESPSDVINACRIAFAYRQRYRKDVFVNLLCYRRWGHNELDDPRFTQPLMYDIIESKTSIPDLYVNELKAQGIIGDEEVKQTLDEHTAKLQAALENVEKAEPRAIHLEGNWKGYTQPTAHFTKWDTGVDLGVLRYIGEKSVEVPKDFNLHPHLQKTHVDARLAQMASGEKINWSTAEAFAIGSALVEGFDVRLSGQDVGRATFCHRHASLVDQMTDRVHIPFNSLVPGQTAFLEVANNPLSEEAVLGFEYGFSIESPKRLCIWEAQFGDFFNGAQIIIDTFISSGESKWLTQSGLVMNLPHGFDGAGPEHSSSRVERFLQLTDSREDQAPPDGDHVNFYVANPTTSAQYFHLLRRQTVTPFRKPLVIVSPKILLRHPLAASTFSAFAPGTTFQPVLDDTKTLDPAAVKKVILTSGKHAFTVMKERDERGLADTAVVRLEGICPFPIEDLRDVLGRYTNAEKFVWSQEEPRNAGVYAFAKPRLANALGIQVAYAGRPELAWTASAVGQLHEQEAKQVIEDTFAA